ncbi:MAG: AcrB/AcrD/AcrF family protein, partial [Calditrichae bacterium]|nr:AcrB/AcrD/AcrF family protein [Calditrichia bacterium]NIW79543.1 AcrB/AcrD/AcrF family protein [Calditrichia bacterium]
MKLPKLAVENHQFTVVIILLLVLSGVFSFLTMPRYEDPQIQPPGTSVIAVYPGATPTDIEELLIDPLEEVINELDDIKEISSIAEDGLMVIGVEFQSGSNPDDKYEEVLQKVSSIQTQLPEDVTSLEVIKHEINTVKILQLALASDSASYRTMEKEAERLKKQLERVAGVRKIETWAFPEQEVRVSLELEKMAQLNISLKQVINAIESASANIPGGNINIGSRRFNIKTSGSYQSLADIRNTIVHSANGKVVYLRDIANIDLGYEDKQYFARFNERRAIFITATQKTETNIFQV